MPAWVNNPTDLLILAFKNSVNFIATKLNHTTEMVFQ